ncbi:MAG: isoleucine--tRNA ligase [Candidatus Aenigmatarchaeota archaeon]
MKKIYNPKELESGIFKLWSEKGTAEKYLAHRNGKKKFYFLDGPPYATGSIHMGTAMNKIIKDFYIRFFTASGFDVWKQPGYDTHGLPIENKVEKKLGFKSKKDIEKFGIKAFNAECKRFATEFIDVMNGQFENLGVWMDWKNPYLTLSNEYIEGAWYTFKTGFEKNLLYRDNYPVHVCPHCETAVAYNEIEHVKLVDPSIFVKFPLESGGKEFFLIWTTTPWTLPANTGIMANPSVEYSKVRVDGETLIMAKDLVAPVMAKAGKDYQIVETFNGKRLEGLKYKNPLKDFFKTQKDVIGKVVLSAQYVTLNEGTGLVHSAPGHGAEDYKVGKANGLAVLSPVGMNGVFTEDVGELKGVFVKKADQTIISKLEEKNALLFKETIEHEYPKCWRCDSALLMISVPQWFFRVSGIREKLLKENASVNWIPKWAGDKFANWLETLGDWPISRQRYWGIPLPIWICEKCGKVAVVGSRKELKKAPADLHRPFIDDVILDCKCGFKMRRVPDVLDVWFDSGVASWASLGFPGDKKLFKRMWPADLNIEGPDQIRGWWNSEIITSMITFGKKPFKNILFHGKVLDLRGAKMSKSKGNVVTPEEVIEKFGRDPLRLYILSMSPWDDMTFSMEDLKDASRTLNILWNSFVFLQSYCPKTKKPKKMNIEDKWIISRINSLAKKTKENNEKYMCHVSAALIEDFILNDLSRFYIKLIRDRTWPSYQGDDKQAACYAMNYVFEKLIKIIAPICPFMAEEIGRSFSRQSVHLLDWPAPEKGTIDSKLEENMLLAKEVAEAVNSARQEAGVKLRWPLKKVVITHKRMKDFSEIIKCICNVKGVVIGKPPKDGKLICREVKDVKIYVDAEMTPELMEESMIRELVRAVQNLRKQSKLNIADKIRLYLNSDEGTNKSIRKWSEYLKSEVGATNIEISGKEQKDFLDFEGKKITIGFVVE